MLFQRITAWLLCTLVLAPIGGLAQDLAVVSAASYRPVVAPDSLAAVFGQNLATGVASAELDAEGQLPVKLAGTSVAIDGKTAPLIFVSPGQINLLVPADVSTGEVEVVVTAGSTSLTLTGTAQIENVAPALFSLDSSGAGPGAIVNAVTFDLEPFRIQTGENPPGDKRTRLALFGTGMRSSPEVPFQNTAASATVRASDDDGHEYDLPVEYVGPAPGFFGLDQANVILIDEIDGVGKLNFRIELDTALSNAVAADIHYLEPPEIRSVQPMAASPGTEIVIEGERFGAFDEDSARLRTIITFEVDGKRFPVIRDFHFGHPDA